MDRSLTGNGTRADQPASRARGRSLLQVADRVATHGEVADAHLAALATDTLPLEAIRTLFAGVSTLYGFAVRQPTIKSSVLKEDLKELKLTAELIPDFVKIVEQRYGRARAGAGHGR